MDVERLVAEWKREEAEPFLGWDFSHLDGRLLEERPPWSYMERAAELMRGASAVLDIDWAVPRSAGADASKGTFRALAFGVVGRVGGISRVGGGVSGVSPITSATPLT